MKNNKLATLSGRAWTFFGVLGPCEICLSRKYSIFISNNQ